MTSRSFLRSDGRWVDHLTELDLQARKDLIQATLQSLGITLRGNETLAELEAIAGSVVRVELRKHS